MGTEQASRKRMTRAGRPEDVLDLLQDAPRANLAFERDGAIEASPVAFRFHEGEYWVGWHGAPPGAMPKSGERVRLLIDDGCYQFDLRGIWVRGMLSEAEEAPRGGAPGLLWHKLEPAKVAVWDYGAMREAKGA